MSGLRTDCAVRAVSLLPLSRACHASPSLRAPGIENNSTLVWTTFSVFHFRWPPSNCKKKQQKVFVLFCFSRLHYKKQWCSSCFEMPVAVHVIVSVLVAALSRNKTMRATHSPLTWRHLKNSFLQGDGKQNKVPWSLPLLTWGQNYHSLLNLCWLCSPPAEEVWESRLWQINILMQWHVIMSLMSHAESIMNQHVCTCDNYTPPSLSFICLYSSL